MPRRLPNPPSTMDGATARWASELIRALEDFMEEQENPATTGWTTSNVTTDRTIDADSTSTAEIADVLCTLIEDLKTIRIITK